MTVGFDPRATSTLTNLVTIPADAVAGTQARNVLGGVVFAGQNGAPTVQGDLPAAKLSPRVGMVYSLNEKTVIRGGYGIYWAPWSYPFPGSDPPTYGNIGYSQLTPVPQTNPVPTVTLDNPYPQGLLQPSGNTRGALTGVGTDINFTDQKKGAPRVQQYSADWQRELPGNMAIKVSYVGARGDHLGLGGANDAAVNINQLDPKYMALGSALNTPLPNPFFGLADAGPLAARATLTRAQLLRPYPQFGNIFMRQTTLGKSRYDAVVLELQKRFADGWGGRFGYTYSLRKDNQYGESNFFSRNANSTLAGTGALNNYNFIEGSAYFNPDAEYSHSILDVPHRVVLSPIVELPFGDGKKWGNKSHMARLLAGGWTISAVISFESGFPITVVQNGDNTGTFGGSQRPNIVPGVDPNTSGDDLSRFNGWINQGAFSAAPAFTFGNAPRTLDNLRTRRRNNADIALQKDVPIKGRSRGQIRIEILNVTGTVKVRGPEQRFGRSDFGQIVAQAGFMRLTQVSFRLTF